MRYDSRPYITGIQRRIGLYLSGAASIKTALQATGRYGTRRMSHISHRKYMSSVALHGRQKGQAETLRAQSGVGMMKWVDLR